MDIELVIGDRDAFAVERQLDFFKQVKTQIPIVGVLAPDAQQEHDRRFPLLVDHDAGGRILQDQRMSLCQFLQHGFCPKQIVVVANGEKQILASRLICGIIDDGGGHHLGVGNGYQRVPGRVQIGVHDLDFLDRAGGAFHFDVIARL